MQLFFYSCSPFLIFLKRLNILKLYAFHVTKKLNLLTIYINLLQPVENSAEHFLYKHLFSNSKWRKLNFYHQCLSTLYGLVHSFYLFFYFLLIHNHTNFWIYLWYKILHWNSTSLSIKYILSLHSQKLSYCIHNKIITKLLLQFYDDICYCLKFQHTSPEHFNLFIEFSYVILVILSNIIWDFFLVFLN